MRRARLAALPASADPSHGVHATTSAGPGHGVCTTIHGLGTRSDEHVPAARSDAGTLCNVSAGAGSLSLLSSHAGARAIPRSEIPTRRAERYGASAAAAPGFGADESGHAVPGPSA